MSTFSLECFQNEYLPEGGDRVNAIVTVTGSGGGPPAATVPAGTSEVIILDVSGSMTGRKLRQAADAARAAIAAVRDGVRFAVVVGNHKAWVLYPPQASLVAASADTRSAAIDQLKNLQASGGTAIGGWITLATTLLGSEPGIRHAILLTDGKDESEAEADLLRALTDATGVFQCDCRGVGTNWEVAELRQVADALLGSVDIVADPAGLAADFASIMATAMARQVAAVGLRVWSPQGADVEFVKQVAPEVSDLTDSRVPVNALAGDYPNRRMGGGVARLPRMRPSRAWRGGRRYAGRPGGIDGRRERLRSGFGQSRVDRRHRSVHPHEPSRGSLHRPSRTGGRHPRRPRGSESRRCRHGNRPTGTGRAARPGGRQHRHRPTPRQGRRR